MMCEWRYIQKRTGYVWQQYSPWIDASSKYLYKNILALKDKYNASEATLTVTRNITNKKIKCNLMDI